MTDARPTSGGKGTSTASAVRGVTIPRISGSTRQKSREYTGQAQEMIGNATDQAISVLEDQKDMAADSLASIAEAVRETGQNLRKRDQRTVAEYTNAMAWQVERLSRFLRDRDVDELVDDVETFARQRPAVLVGGAFVLGLVGARFLKSSSQRRIAARSRARRAASAKPTSLSEHQRRTSTGTYPKKTTGKTTAKSGSSASSKQRTAKSASSARKTERTSKPVTIVKQSAPTLSAPSPSSETGGK